MYVRYVSAVMNLPLIVVVSDYVSTFYSVIIPEASVGFRKTLFQRISLFSHIDSFKMG